MTSDDRLRAAYQRAIAARGTAERDACVTPDALLALVRRDGTEAVRLATLDHAMGCAACRAEFELLRAIDRAGREGTREAVTHLRWKRNLTMALAASAVFAIAVGPGRRLIDRDGAGEVRSSGGTEVVLLEPGETGSLATAGPIRFTWHAVPGAQRYTLELLAGDGRVAASHITGDTTLHLPAPGVAPGEYHWTVRTLAEDGSVWRSRARRLRVEP